MKKMSKTIRWAFTVLFGICALGNGFHISTLPLVLATVLLMPIDVIQYFVRDKLKLKKGLALTLAIVLFFAGILSSPHSDTPPDVTDNSSMTSSVEDDISSVPETTSSENSSEEEVSSVTSSDKADSSAISSETTDSSQNISSEDTSSKEEVTSSSKPQSSSGSTVTSTVSSEEEQSSVGTGNATAVDLSDIPKYSGKP